MDSKVINWVLVGLICIGVVMAFEIRAANARIEVLEYHEAVDEDTILMQQRKLMHQALNRPGGEAKADAGK